MNEQLTKNVVEAAERIQGLVDETQKVIIGQDRLIRNLLVALFARGHIIVEWVPGLAKTLAIETLGKTLGVDVSRIQFTPDLLPSDLIGTQIRNPSDASFSTQKWPVFSHMILADEINRAPAKVQSALLEAMSERQVTIGQTSYALEAPFVVMATQNPVENDGTYDLPEAQLDRFLLKTNLGYPSPEEELQIMKRFAGEETPEEVQEIMHREQVLAYQELTDQIHISESIFEYVRNIVVATRFPGQIWLPDLEAYIQFGASPRASLALIKAAKVIALMHARTFVIPEDIQEIAEDVLKHRLVLHFDSEIDGITIESLIQQILKAVSVV